MFILCLSFYGDPTQVEGNLRVLPGHTIRTAPVAPAADEPPALTLYPPPPPPYLPPAPAVPTNPVPVWVPPAHPLLPPPPPVLV